MAMDKAFLFEAKSIDIPMKTIDAVTMGVRTLPVAINRWMGINSGARVLCRPPSEWSL